MANEFVARNGIIALNDSQITGSLRLSNGSYSGSGAQLYDIPVAGIVGINSGSNVTQSFDTPSSTWTFNHNLGNSNVIIQTYDLGNNQIIPQNIQLFNANSAVITFPTLEAGYAIATLGGSTINNIVVNISGSSGSFATTGSNTFIGNQLITGSVQVTGGTIIGTLTGNADTATTASYAETASYVENAQTASYVVLAESASFALNALTASYVQLAESASFVTTAATASFANTLYQADGTIAGARTVTLGNNSLTFVGLTRTNRFFANGNIGIGTLVDSGDNLNVSGSALINGTLSVSNNITTPVDIAGTTTTRFFANGNVGIGTTTDGGQRLNVNGTANVQTSLTVGNGVATFGYSSPNAFIDASGAGWNFEIRRGGTTFYKLWGSVGRNIFSNVNDFTDIPSSLLSLNTTNLGFLPPRMTTTQKNAISTPAQGLIVYDTTSDRLNYRDVNSWEEIPTLAEISNNISPAANLFNYYNFY